MKVLILPGLDGTGRLLGAFTAALPPPLAGIVVSYPTGDARGYDELGRVVDAARPVGERIVIVAESFSGPLALRAASVRLLAVRADVPVVQIDSPHLLLQRQPAAAGRAVANFCRSVAGGQL